MSGVPLVITRWATQAGRRRAALEPSYVRIDERSFPELLAYSAAFAGQIRYFGPDDMPDGDWSDFFRADIAMVLAIIMTFDGDRRAAEFRALRLRARTETSETPKFELLQHVAETILGLAREVDGWLAAVEQLEATRVSASVRRLLASTIRHELAGLLEQLRAYGAGAGQGGALGRAIDVDCRNFHHVWGVGDICPDSSIYRGYLRREKIDAALEPLDSLHDGFLMALADLAGRAKSEFEACLNEPRHKPHIALFMAFVKQFGMAQERINDLPRCLVNFYYRDVLCEPLRRPTADRVFLSFILAPQPGVAESTIPAGTRFPAGADAKGRPILFAADQSLAVTPTVLARVRTQRAVRGPLLQDVPSATIDATDHLRLIVAAKTKPGAAGTPGAALRSGWPMFGSPADTAGDSVAAPLGFLVTSRALLLTGGERSIKIIVWSSSSSRQAKLDPLLQRIAAATGLAAEAVLSRVLKEAVSLSVTTDKGWQPIETFDVEIAPGAMGKWSIAFSFRLAATAPGLGALDPLRARELTDPAPDPQLPAVMARLSQDAIAFTKDGTTVKVYPLSLLEAMPVDNVVIETKVENLTPVQITTSSGPAEASTGFAPFGSPARAGTWFEIRHPELFAKTLEKLTIAIQWLGLPSHPAGFAGHYEQYVIGPNREPIGELIDNHSFRATLSLRGDLPWKLPSGSEKPVCLFRTEARGDASGAVAAKTYLAFPNLEKSEAAKRGPLSAALRLTLSEPRFGFGDELYAPNVLNAVQLGPHVEAPPPRRGFCRLLRWLAVLRAPNEPLAPPDLARAYPNPPWQPQIAGISVDYDAIDRVDAAAGEFMHLLPSGSLEVAGGDDVVTLLPTSGDLTHLQLAFSGLAPRQPLTLLFQLAKESGRANVNGRVTWQRREAGRWTDLDVRTIRRDGTNSLTNSGIIEFDLPQTELDAKADRLCWLRAVPRSDPDGFPSIVAITPHALSATRLMEDDAEPPLPILAKTVKAARTTLRAIATIDQPIASFGGEVAESADMFPIRLGERLRHKERASLAWDYERLVLARFPEISKVRALPHGTTRSNGGGDVSVVVMPAAANPDLADDHLPRVGADTCTRIAASLRAAASPFARIAVIDPIYVRVTATARVLFRTIEGNAAVRLNEDLCDFLSPRTGGLDLPDDAREPEIRAAIRIFIESRPYVASLIDLGLSFTPALESVAWCVPASAARHEIVAESDALRIGARCAVKEDSYA